MTIAARILTTGRICEGENDFFDQIPIVIDHMHGSGDNLLKQKPCGQTHSEPHNEGGIGLWTGPETEVEDNPENDDHDQRLDDRPNNAHGRAHVLFGNFPSRQFNDEFPMNIYQPEKTIQRFHRRFQQVSIR